MSRRQFYWHGFRVPFIAPWSSETTRPGTIVLRRGVGGEGIGYLNEYSGADRRNGVLWVRMAAVRGVGKPLLAKVHALRQRQAMNHMLCQVCGMPTLGRGNERHRRSRGNERHLFLMRDTDGRPIREGEQTAMPPIHEACASEAMRDCPHLREGCVAALVEYAPAWGVAGIVHDPKTLQPLPPEDGELTFVAYRDPRIRWTLAARDVVALQGCIAIDLDDLAARAAA
jgi:hypothetical protein